MNRVNRSLYFKTDKKVFTALCLVSIDIRTRELTFINAGLNEPLLKSGDSATKLASAGIRFPLGVKRDNMYREKKQPLAAGDVIVFCTDGITEAKNPHDEFYGFEALKELLERMDTTVLTAKEIKDEIIAEVKHFSAGAPQHDDMTVVIVKVLK
jgi:sigma-B regulation protein RsbU (phosphoserine phosphatase)